MSDKSRLTDRNRLTAAVASGALEFYVVDTTDKTENEAGSSYKVSLDDLKTILGIDGLLNEKSINSVIYADVTEMLADQDNHTLKQIQFVVDASSDTTVEAGEAFYEYIGPASGVLSNYRKLSAAEASLFKTSQKEVKINGYWVDTTENELADRNRIKAGNQMRGKGDLFNGEYILAEAKVDDANTEADIKIYTRF